MWKPVAKRSSPWVIIAATVYQDGLRRFGLRSDQIDQAPVTPNIADALAHINAIYSNYQRHLALADVSIKGTRVLEIGPGDNIGVALRFIGAGADRVLTVDKFVPLGTSGYHQALYKALRAERTEEERRAIDAALDLTNGVQPRPRHLTALSGVGIEEHHAELPPESFDIIVSNAVLEEVYNIDEAFAGMDRLLRPGGYHVHKVDLGDYGMFTRHGYHPLEFLTIPDGVYRYMVESTGQPNRRLVDYYRRKAAEFGYSARIYISRTLGAPQELDPPRAELCPCEQMAEWREQIREIRPRLLERYRTLPDEDLIIQGIVFVAQKPRQPNRP